MTPTSGPVTAHTDRISLDDVRHKALAIKREVRDEVEIQVSSRRTQLIVAGIVVAAIGFGIAYYLGSRAGRAAAEPSLD